MPTIIDNRTQMDLTVQVFDDFYSTDLKVPAGEFDLVYSYFVGICSTKNVADNFTVLFFRIAQESNVKPIDLLETLKGNSYTTVKLNEIMTYYLNSFKSKTSLYGIGVVPKPNQSVARNVVL